MPDSTLISDSNAGWRGGPARSMAVADETSRRLLAADTVPDALAAVVNDVAGVADFCLVLQVGRVPGADLHVVAVWDAERGPEAPPEGYSGPPEGYSGPPEGYSGPPGRPIPYALLAPFFEVEPAPAPGPARGVLGSARGVLGSAREELAATWPPHLETAVVTDVSHDGRITPGFRQFLAITRAASFVAVPMSFQGQTRAVFVVGRRQPVQYEPELVRHFETIAGQIAVVLRNLVLLQQSQARAAQLEAVAEISSAASSILDPDELLPLAVELIRERFHLYYVGIFLLGPDGRRVTLRAGTGAAGQRMVEAGHHFAVGEESMIGWCVANRQPRIALDVGQEAVRFDNPLLPDTRSEMALPLLSRGPEGTQVLVGAMTIQSTEQAAFDQGDVTVLLVMADQLANAIENAHSFQERERRMTQMGIVNEIGQALSTGIDLNVLFALVHKQVSRLFDADNFYIALYEEGRDFWASAFHLEQGQPQPQARHSVASGLTGWILRHQAPILLRSRDENTAFHEQEGIPSIGERARSWLGVPLVVSQKLLGAMAIQDYELEYRYEESDRSLFETIGAQVAAALDNARLLETTRKRAQEMQVINEVGRVVTSVLDLDEVLRRLVDVTKERFGYYCVSIALVSGQRIEIKYGSYVGDTQQRLDVHDLVVDIEAEHSLVAECARTGQPVLVGDVRQAPRYLFLTQLPDTRAELTVPILARGQVIGTLDVQSEQSFAFDERNVAVLQLLASQAGTAIENAQLFTETRRRADELGVLHQVSLELAQEQHDLRTALETIAHRTMDLLDSDGGGVWLWQEALQALELVITYQVAGVEFAGRRLRPGEGLTGKAFVRNQIQVVDDYLTWEGRAALFADAPFVSAMAVPMRWRAETVGVLVATRSQAGRPYRLDERELAELLAAQAASVIQNARLFADREARAEELAIVNEVGRAISSVLDLDSVLQQIVDSIKERFRHFFVGMLLVDGTELVFRSSSTIGSTDARVRPGELHLALDGGRSGSGVTVAVATSGESILVNDVSQDSRYGIVEGLEPVRAELDTPIKVKGKVIGVLTVQSDRLNAFDEGDVNLLLALASQAGVAIDNARLFEQAQEQVSNLAQIQAALADLNAAFTFDQAIAVLLPHVARIGRADRVRMYLVHGTQMTCVGVHSSGGRDAVQVGETVSLDDYPLTRQVVETGQPFSVLSDDPRLQPHARQAYRAAGLAANATIPLIGRQGVTGILSINRQRPGGAFEAQEVSLVQTLANQATTVLEKSQLLEETEQRTAELQSLYDTSLRLSTYMETTELLTAVIERAAALLEAETAGLYVYEPGSNELVFSVGTGYLTEYVGRRVAPGEGLAGRVFQERRVMTVEDYHTWAGRAVTYEQEERLGTLLAVPLISGERNLGVLVVGVARGGQVFSPRHVRLAELFGAQAAVALENARLFEEAQTRARQQATLRHISETVSSSLDAETMLETTLEQTLVALRLDAGLISLYSPQSGRLVLSVQRGVPEPMVRVLEKKGLGGTLCEYVYLTGQTISIGDVREGAPVSVDALIKNGLVGYAGTPLSSKGERIGTMCFFHHTARKVADDELALLEAIGGQVALGITNVRLFRETEMRAEELAILNEMGHNLTMQLDVAGVLENTYRYTARLMDANNFYIALYHPETDEVSFPIATEQGQRLKWSRRQSGNGLTEHLIRSARPLLIKKDVDGYVSSELGVELIGHVAESWLGAPLMTGDRVLGVIAVQSYDTPYLYTERHQDLLVAVASQTAIALQNARLFEETETRAEELAVLNEMARALTARLDVDEVLKSTYHYVARLMDARHFYIALHHPETDSVSFAFSMADGEIVPPATRRKGRGLTEYIIRTAEPLLIRHDTKAYLSQLEGIDHIGQEAQSWLGTPLMIGEQVLGVIAVQSYETPNLYTERDRDLLVAAASQAAIALQNARLFEQAEGRAQYERVLREITAQVRASTNADTIMRTAVRELGSALDRPTFIRLAQPPARTSLPDASRQSLAGDGDHDHAREVPGSAREVPGSARQVPGTTQGHLGEGGE